MNIEEAPPWPGRRVAKLGELIVAREDGGSQGVPTYAEVMNWHSDLCDEVSLQISTRENWETYDGELDVSARAKTIDTLREKLEREKIRLNQVQDLAGVRVDIDGRLSTQTALAQEIADMFGVERAIIKDLRGNPHSGYRAVHVWLRLPAGRVEVQIRTRGQSAWANVNEQLADRIGREIRYGSPGRTDADQDKVSLMLEASESLLTLENTREKIARLEHSIGQVHELLDMIDKSLLDQNVKLNLRLRWMRWKARRMSNRLAVSVRDLTADGAAIEEHYLDMMDDVQSRLEAEWNRTEGQVS